MKKILFVVLCSFLFVVAAYAQTTKPSTAPSKSATTQSVNQNTSDMSTTPYHQIGDYPTDYSAASVLQRTIDGLGYRLYWATEGLTEKDLAYAPGNEGKTAYEVLTHLYFLSNTILTTIKGEVNIRPNPEIKMKFEAMRHATLSNIMEASDYLNANKQLDLEKLEVVFQRGEKKSASPFWHLVNGPILDAVYHAGQIVSYRRSSGNPVHPKVNVFSGKAPF